METDIEWLFEEIYKQEKQNPHKSLYFISDWDSEVENHEDFRKILHNAQVDSESSIFRYSFAYEQFSLKAQILDFSKELYGLDISEYSITLTPSATQAIYLSLLALKKLNVQRYLVVTPAYFSIFESLKNHNLQVFYYHLLDQHDFAIDFANLEKTIKEQYIDCIIFTDPVFSAGIEFPVQYYQKLAKLAKEYNIYLFVDYSLGGLAWNPENLSILNYNKLKELFSGNKYVFIDSLSKRLLLNGVKFSIVFASEDVIDQIDLAAESIFGGLNSIQIETIRQLYSINNTKVIIGMQEKQLKKIKSNYNLIKSLIKNKAFIMAPSNSGFFTTISSTQLTFAQVDVKDLVLNLLKEDSLIMIPNNRFSYYQDNRFGWRINLAKNQADLLPALNICVRKIAHRFSH